METVQRNRGISVIDPPDNLSRSMKAVEHSAQPPFKSMKALVFCCVLADLPSADCTVQRFFLKIEEKLYSAFNPTYWTCTPLWHTNPQPSQFWVTRFTTPTAQVFFPYPRLAFLFLQHVSTASLPLAVHIWAESGSFSITALQVLEDSN